MTFEIIVPSLPDYEESARLRLGTHPARCAFCDRELFIGKSLTVPLTAAFTVAMRVCESCIPRADALAVDVRDLGWRQRVTP